ncbi:hypothetical protein SEA_BETTERKATZ_44 [Gordonia phage BetterKatz]|uniref:Uncharacterized protein n=1 Tax=Gordonia phage BetterKatz TaxID=1821551 RepID=A0A142KC46_9CAUD|nr:hypothetical protein BJD67_gp44 [Gordonia phage BetterKatz]AMS03679.1 hypothetical protein SEA_BETTERKATZ_44 [Gordonia phage BetterKatz]
MTNHEGHQNVTPDVSAVTLTTTYTQPSDGWPLAALDAFGIAFAPATVTITASADTTGKIEVLPVVAVTGHIGDQAVTTSASIDALPPYVLELVEHAKLAAAHALAVA